MSEYRCKNCAKYTGNCGNHHTEHFTKHINYEIPAEYMFDRGCDIPNCFVPSDDYKEKEHDKLIKEIMAYGLNDVKEAYEELLKLRDPNVLYLSSATKKKTVGDILEEAFSGLDFDIFEDTEFPYVEIRDKNGILVTTLSTNVWFRYYEGK